MQVTTTIGSSQPWAIRPVSLQTKFGLTWQRVITVAIQEHRKNIANDAARCLVQSDLVEAQQRAVLRKAAQLAGQGNITVEHIQTALQSQQAQSAV